MANAGRAGWSPSFWETTTFLNDFDVLVIGGGIVGCSCALQIQVSNPGLKVGIIERGPIPMGASTRNAGFACFGSLSEIIDDIDKMGMDDAIALIARRKAGLDLLCSIVSPEAMHYMTTGGLEVFTKADRDIYDQCMTVLPDLNERLKELFGADPFEPDDMALERNGLFNFEHAISYPFEGSLHPGLLVEQLYTRAVSAGVRVLCGFAVDEIEDDGAHVSVTSADGVCLKCRFAVLATNGFAQRLMPELEVTPSRNQVLLTAPLDNVKLHKVVHYNKGYVYFRPVEDRLLIGGARNIAMDEEATDEFGVTEHIKSWLRAFFHEHIYPGEIEFAYAWSGILGVGDTKVPIVRMVFPRIAVAVRLGGMGVAIGAGVGGEAASLINERLS